MCARVAWPALLCGPSTSPLERMEEEPSGLTTSDRLCWAGFAIFILTWTLAGAVAVTALPGGEVAAGLGQWSDAATCLLGMFGGTAVGLLLARFVSHSLVSRQTQRRWLAALDEALENPYVQRRGAGVVRLFMWAVVPDRHAL